MKAEDKQREFEETLDLIYEELESILEHRPHAPVTAFAKQ